MTVLRSGRFYRREHVGCEHRSIPLSGNRPQASLKAGSVRSRSGDIVPDFSGSQQDVGVEMEE
jgi:hypothetical protein